MSETKPLPCKCLLCLSRPPCPPLDVLPRYKMPTHDEWAIHGTDWYISRLQWRLTQAEDLLNAHPQAAQSPQTDASPGRFPGWSTRQLRGYIEELEKTHKLQLAALATPPIGGTEQMTKREKLEAAVAATDEAWYMAGDEHEKAYAARNAAYAELNEYDDAHKPPTGGTE